VAAPYQPIAEVGEEVASGEHDPVALRTPRAAAFAGESTDGSVEGGVLATASFAVATAFAAAGSAVETSATGGEAAARGAIGAAAGRAASEEGAAAREMATSGTATVEAPGGVEAA